MNVGMNWGGVRNEIILLIILVAVIMSSCTKDSGPIVIRPETDTISFNDTILPIFQANCVEYCHPPSGGLDLTAPNAYAGLVDVASISPGPIRVKPFEPENSMLYLRVAGDQAGTRMPLGTPQALSVGEIGLIYDWIAQGALDN
ncbi:MAG: hypothetical protein QF371_01635 [Flavobacteriales bacterium]|nr:hypothetical protein [Flavobacteriales bacterium]